MIITRYSVDSDLEKIAAVVKEMNVMSEASAILLAREAEARHGTEAKRLYQMAHNRFQEAVVSASNNKRVYLEWGKMLATMALRFHEDSLSLLFAAKNVRISIYRTSFIIVG